jgi:phospholipid/cholesterol/gamma-HCH transport system permease protein
LRQIHSTAIESSLIGTTLITLGALALTTAAAFKALILRRFATHQTLRQIHLMSVESLPVLIAASVLCGGIMAIEAATYVEMTGTHTMLGWAFGLMTLAEVGPAVVALMFAGRSGSRATAELGTMAVTGQIDALRLLAIDPVEYLAAPRFLAMIVMLPLMIALCDGIALISGTVAAALIIDVSPRMFWQSMQDGHLLDEFTMGLVKGFFFAGGIAAISTTFGLRTRGGASGVGHAVNDCVVASALAVFIIDYVITVLWL